MEWINNVNVWVLALSSWMFAGAIYLFVKTLLIRRDKCKDCIAMRAVVDRELARIREIGK